MFVNLLHFLKKFQSFSCKWNQELLVNTLCKLSVVLSQIQLILLTKTITNIFQIIKNFIKLKP